MFRPSSAACALVAIATTLGVLGCIAYRGGRVQPGVALPMSEPPRDPDPTRDPTEIYAPLRQEPHFDRAPASGSPSPLWSEPRIQELAATLAIVLAGAIPLIQLTVTFEENALFEDPPSEPIAEADAGPGGH